MLVIDLVVLGNLQLRITSQDILGYLLVTSFKILNEIFQNMDFVCLKMDFEEHMVRNYHCQRNPTQRTLLYTRLEEVRMVTYLFESHQDVHHTC